MTEQGPVRTSQLGAAKHMGDADGKCMDPMCFHDLGGVQSIIRPHCLPQISDVSIQPDSRDRRSLPVSQTGNREAATIMGSWSVFILLLCGRTKTYHLMAFVPQFPSRNCLEAPANVDKLVVEMLYG